MPGDARLFQQSISQELIAIKNRVRNLIGNAHWGEEGRFKEAVLKNILRQFLPRNLSVGTGFILDANGDNDDENRLSTQLDIIVYNNTLPVLFSEGEFIITTLTNVKAIIEVKSRITPNTITEIIERFDYSVRHFTAALQERRIFSGIFAFEFDGNINSRNIDDALMASSRLVNHISLGSNFFAKKWSRADRNRLAIPVACDGDFYNFYNIESLSFSYFISNLIDITSGGLNDRYWFSFPIEGTKELHRLRTICLD